MPSAKLAGLMAAAIVSDTVMFKSPTCTNRDRKMAERMAHIANLSLDELGREIFSASTPEDKPVDQLLFTDFKEFHIAGHDFGVSQITCVDSDRQLRRKAHPIVPHRDPQHPRLLTDPYLHHAALHPLQTVENGVFHQGLENHLGDQAALQLLREIDVKSKGL